MTMSFAPFPWSQPLDHFDRSAHVIYYIIRNGHAVGLFVRSVAGSYQKGRGAGSTAHLDIGSFIADHDAEARFETELRCCLLKETGCWFSALTAVCRSMRTEIDTIEHHIFGSEQLFHPLMNLFEPCPVEKAPADSRLVRNDHQPVSDILQRAKRRSYPREKPDVLRIRQIVAFFDHRPVAVQDDEFLS